MDFGKPDLNPTAAAPALPSTRLPDMIARFCLCVLFGLALWSLVLLTELGTCTFVTFAFAGTFIIHIALRDTKRWELPAAVLAGALYGFGYVRHGGALATIPGSRLGIACAFCGIGSMLVTSIRGIWESDPAAVKSNRANLLELGSVPMLCILSAVGVSLAARSLVMTYDTLLYAFDASLGYPPGFAVGQFFRGHAGMAYCSALAYNYLPIGLVALRAVQLREQRNELDVRLIYAALGGIGFCLYAICPGIGPINRFPSFPYTLPASVALAPVPAGPLLPRNAMPSLHVGWALLVFVNSWAPWRSYWAPFLGSLFLILTAVATLGSGEHFLIDLIVVAPLTLAIQSGLRASGSLRKVGLITGSTFTLSWLLALRTGAWTKLPVAPAVSIGLALLTVTISGVLHWMIARKNWAAALGK